MILHSLVPKKEEHNIEKVSGVEEIGKIKGVEKIKRVREIEKIIEKIREIW